MYYDFSLSPIKMSEENDFQSNRPYSLFYYPSSRLPLLAMPEDERRQFWCLLDSNDSKDKPFFVDAGLKWNMDQLTQAIQKKRRALRDLDTSDIVLWKVRVSYIHQRRRSCSFAFAAERTHSS